MVLTFDDSLFLFKNYNILILYDYRYYCDFNILFNILIPCPNTDTLYTLDRLYIIDESIRKLQLHYLKLIL